MDELESRFVSQLSVVDARHAYWKWMHVAVSSLLDRCVRRYGDEGEKSVERMRDMDKIETFVDVSTILDRCIAQNPPESIQYKDERPTLESTGMELGETDYEFKIVFTGREDETDSSDSFGYDGVHDLFVTKGAYTARLRLTALKRNDR